MEDFAAWVFTIVSAIGLVITYLLLMDSMKDKEAVDQANTKNGRFLIVRSSMRTQAIKMVVFMLFLAVGLLVVSDTIVPASLVRLLLATGAILLMVNTVLDYKTKRKLLGN